MVGAITSIVVRTFVDGSKGKQAPPYLGEFRKDTVSIWKTVKLNGQHTPQICGLVALAYIQAVIIVMQKQCQSVGVMMCGVMTSRARK